MNRLCALCKTAVLGIQGNDIVIQPYFLHSSEGARLEPLAGSVHSSCLHRSQYSQIYLDAMKVYVTEVLRPRLFRAFDRGFIARHENTREIIIVFDQAFSIRVSSKQIAEAEGTTLGLSVSCKSQIAVDHVLPNSEIVSLLGEFKRGGIALTRLMELTKTAQTIGPYTQVEGAVLRPYSDDPEASFESLQKQVICGELSHHLLLPPSIGDVAKSLLAL